MIFVLSNTEKAKIKEFLLKYNFKYPLGYGNTEGHTVFFFNIPNNTPDILWNSKLQSKGLMPLFQRTDDISIYPMSQFFKLDEQVL